MAKIKFVPDPAHTKILKEAAKTSAERAIRETKALDLPITYLENGKIYKETADGKRKIIGKV